jgi:hypothetical protein
MEPASVALPQPPREEEEEKEEESERVCTICWNAPRSVALTACGHSVLCAPCAEELQARRKPCPVCRAPIPPGGWVSFAAPADGDDRAPSSWLARAASYQPAAVNPVHRAPLEVAAGAEAHDGARVGAALSVLVPRVLLPDEGAMGGERARLQARAAARAALRALSCCWATASETAKDAARASGALAAALSLTTEEASSCVTPGLRARALLLLARLCAGHAANVSAVVTAGGVGAACARLAEADERDTRGAAAATALLLALVASPDAACSSATKATLNAHAAALTALRRGSSDEGAGARRDETAALVGRAALSLALLAALEGDDAPGALARLSCASAQRAMGLRARADEDEAEEEDKMEVADDTMRWEAGGAEEEEEDDAAREPRGAAAEEDEDAPPRYVRDGDLSAAVAALATAVTPGAPRTAAPRAARWLGIACTLHETTALEEDAFASALSSLVATHDAAATAADADARHAVMGVIGSVCMRAEPLPSAPGAVRASGALATVLRALAARAAEDADAECECVALNGLLTVAPAVQADALAGGGMGAVMAALRVSVSAMEADAGGDDDAESATRMALRSLTRLAANNDAAKTAFCDNADHVATLLAAVRAGTAPLHFDDSADADAAATPPQATARELRVLASSMEALGVFSSHLRGAGAAAAAATVLRLLRAGAAGALRCATSLEGACKTLTRLARAGIARGDDDDSDDDSDSDDADKSQALPHATAMAALTALPALLRRMPRRKDLACEAAKAIGMLAANNGGRKRHAVRAGTVPALLRALALHPVSGSAVTALANALGVIGVRAEARKQLRAGAAAGALTAALTLNALQLRAEPAASAVAALLKLCAAHGTAFARDALLAGVVAAATTALAAAAEGADSDNEEERFSEEEAADVEELTQSLCQLLSVLTHADEDGNADGDADEEEEDGEEEDGDETDEEDASDVPGRTRVSSRSAQAHAGMFSTLDALVRLLEAPAAADADAPSRRATLAASALLNLCANNHANKAAAGAAGAMPALVHAMEVHEACAEMASTGCWAIGVLGSERANKAPALTAGALAAVVAAMRRHAAMPDVAREGAGAIMKLVANDASLRADAAACDAAAAVRAALAAHPAEVGENGYEALRRMRR